MVRKSFLDEQVPRHFFGEDPAVLVNVELSLESKPEAMRRSSSMMSCGSGNTRQLMANATLSALVLV